MKKSNSDVGHARLVADFITLVNICLKLVGLYNPSNPLFQTNSLSATQASAEQSMENVRKARADFKRLTNEREIAFGKLGKICRKLVKAFLACSPSAQAIDDVKQWRDKVVGTRSKKKNAEETAEPAGEQPREISTSQQSYTYRLENFRNMVASMLKDPKYTPNEEKYTEAGLTGYIAELQAINLAAIDSDIILDKAIAERNKLFYAESTGIADIGKGVKAYIQSLEEVGADTLKQLVTLQFKNR